MIELAVGFELENFQNNLGRRWRRDHSATARAIPVFVTIYDEDFDATVTGEIVALIAVV